MFNGAKLSIPNYDDLLLGWSKLQLYINLEFNAGYSQYSSNGKDARQYIIDTYN